MRLTARLAHERLRAVAYEIFLDYKGGFKRAKELGRDNLLAEHGGLDDIRAKIQSQNLSSLEDRHIRLNTTLEFDHVCARFLSILSTKPWLTSRCSASSARTAIITSLKRAVCGSCQ